MESFLENLKLQVQCSLCNETMVEPKLLECFHTFCKACIPRNAQLDGQVNIFSCPQCESSTELQELNDVEDLEISPIHSRILQVLSFVENQKVCSVSASHSDALWRCLDCDRSLCAECLNSHSIFIKDHRVISLSEMTKENIEVMLRKESSCKIHVNYDMESFCQDCDKPVCPICMRDYHTKHKITSLHDFITAKKDSLSKNLEEIDSLNSDEEEKKQQEQIAVDIKRDGQGALPKVKELTKKLMKNLIDQEQELLNEIQTSMTKADWNLRIIRHTQGAQEYIKHLIENGTASDMVNIGSEAECSTTFTYNAFAKHIAGIEFKPNEQLSEQVNTGLGLVRETFVKADPKMTSLKVDTSQFVANNTATLTVVLNEGGQCDSSMDDVTIHLTPENDVKIGEKHVTTDGQIEVALTPVVPGKFTAEVQVHGTPVSNSPLVMGVKPQHIREMAKHSKLKIALNQAKSRKLSGIAVNKSNTKVALADCGLHCIKVFNMEGKLLLLYGGGKENRELNVPQGLAFLNETDLVIADSGNRRICILDTTTGNLVKVFNLKQNFDSERYPCGVHVDDDSNIIVSDSHRCVEVFTRNGDSISKIVVPNKGRPVCTITHNGLLYVSDRSSVQVIQIVGRDSPTTVATIGGVDYTDGRLEGPQGLAIDKDNNLLVCDSKSCKVLKFTLDGRFVGGTSWLNFMRPQYIAVLNDGQIICTTEGMRVFFFN